MNHHPQAINHNTLHGEHIKALTSQNKIGWNNIIFGFWSLHWTTVQQHYSKERGKQPNHARNHSWIQKIAHILSNHRHERWMQRSKLQPKSIITIHTKGLLRE